MDDADNKSLLWLFENAPTPEAKEVARRMLWAFAHSPTETPEAVRNYLIDKGMWDKNEPPAVG